MSEPTAADYGAWPSPLAISLLTEGAVAFEETPVASDGRLWWIEGRPEEEGRHVLVRRERDGSHTRMTPEGFDVRNRVHEYGGAPFLVDGDLVVVSEFATGRLHRVKAPDGLEPITPEGAWRYADAVLDRSRNRLIAVREDHSPETLERHGEAENLLVEIDLATGRVTPLVEGADFYAAPRLAPGATQLAWLEWRHPNMPWDGMELKVAGLRPDGSVSRAQTVAGSQSEWVTQPRWSPDGVLYFMAEPTGWMNLHRLVDGRVEAVTAMEAELAGPDWRFGNSSYAFMADGSIVMSGRQGGRDRLWRIGADGGIGQVDVEFTEMARLAADGSRVCMLAASPTRSASLVAVDPHSGAIETIRGGMTAEIDPADLSIPELVEFPTSDGRTAFGLFYAPHSREARGPAASLPPLMVTSHGGPTSAAYTGLSVRNQLYASRGIAVLDVDYGGSTGYGRAYRKRLEGEWGVVDLDDCVNGARWLAEQGRVDGSRLAMRGGSASGYTTLCAITFRDAFRAGISYFGIGDLETFVAGTHKFESRYLDRLVGPYPERRDLYRERSPLNFTDRISCPVLVLQGADDRVVPPAQAEQIVDALRANRLPHAYLLIPSESHGFRIAKNIIRAFEAELSFLGQVFGFVPADAIEPIEVAFLER